MGASTSTFGLLDRIRSGDSSAVEVLFEKHRRRLAVLIHFKISPEVRRTAEVDDILQETLLRAFREMDSFTYRAPGSFLHWLSRIADRVIIDTVRYGNRQRRNGEIVPFRSESNPGGPEPANTLTPSRILANDQALTALLERLNALPEDYRQAILLAKVEGLTTQEMAERLNKTREATALLLHRAIKRFRTLSS